MFEEFKTASIIRISFRKKGFMLVEPDGYLSMIYTRPEKRKLGYADRMISYAKRLFPKLYAIPGSEAGERLLKKHSIPSPQ
jgi:ribosomal protein S18 acetylase RimI-like enzyme